MGNNPSCRLGRKQCVSMTAHNTPACLAVFVFGLLGHFGVYSGAEAAPPWTMTCCFWKLLRQASLCPQLQPRAASPSGRGAGPWPALSGRRARRTARQTHAEPEDTVTRRFNTACVRSPCRPHTHTRTHAHAHTHGGVLLSRPNRFNAACSGRAP